MTLPLVTTESSPHTHLQTEVRMMERTQFSRTLTSLTSNICWCLMGMCPHKWGCEDRTCRTPVSASEGARVCHCCSQSHDPRAVPSGLRLMVRHSHTTASLVLSVNVLTLMLNHFTASARCVHDGSLTHTCKGKRQTQALPGQLAEINEQQTGKTRSSSGGTDQLWPEKVCTPVKVQYKALHDCISAYMNYSARKHVYTFFVFKHLTQEVT